MFIGYAIGDDNELLEAHAFEYEDGCTIPATGVDRADARGQADTDHYDAHPHTAACEQLSQLLGQALAMKLHCAGECAMTELDATKLMSPPCTQYSTAGTRARAHEAGALQ